MTLIYDGSYEGFLCTVFAAYQHHVTANANIRTNADGMTLEEEVSVSSQTDQADRVAHKLQCLKIAEWIYDAWISRAEGIDDHLLAVIVLAVQINGSPMGRRQMESVSRVAAAAKRVRDERYRFLEFTRFLRICGGDPKTAALTSLSNASVGIYVADIEPEYDILIDLVQHFVKRFQDQKFMIRDKTHGTALVYDAQSWQIVELPELMSLPLPDESRYEELWRRYFDTVAIPWRRNRKLQQQFVPKKYRRYLTEFQPADQSLSHKQK